MARRPSTQKSQIFTYSAEVEKTQRKSSRPLETTRTHLQLRIRRFCSVHKVLGINWFHNLNVSEVHKVCFALIHLKNHEERFCSKASFLKYNYRIVDKISSHTTFWKFFLHHQKTAFVQEIYYYRLYPKLGFLTFKAEVIQLQNNLMPLVTRLICGSVLYILCRQSEYFTHVWFFF